MKKRVVSLLLCLIMALSLIPTAAFATEAPDADSTPEVQAATDEIATYVHGYLLNWNYAVISEKANGGYNISRASGTDDLSAHVSVTFNGTAQNKNSSTFYPMSQNSEGDAVISVDKGYYIAYVVLCCNDGTGYSCKTSMGQNAFGQKGSMDGRSVTIKLSDIYSHANHGYGSAEYWLMVMVAPIPNPVYVGYESGSINGTAISAAPVVKDSGTWVDIADKFIKQYPTKVGEDAPTHDVLAITPEAEAEANKLGYTFAGWQLTYYTTYKDGNFSAPTDTGNSGIKNEKDVIHLYTHAKLVAQWKKVEITTGSLTITKKVNAPMGTTTPDSFTFTVSGYSDPVTVTAADNWTKTITVNAGTYTVTENASTVPGGYELKTTYAPEKGTVTVTAGGSATVTVVNTYTKIFGDDIVNPASLTVFKKDARTDALLSGAEFQLLKKVGNDYVAVGTPVGTTSAGMITFTALEPGDYQLKETKAPANYVGWTDHVFAFTVVKNDEPTDAARYNETTKQFEKVYDCDIVLTSDLEEGFKDFYKNYSFANNELTVYNEKIESAEIDVKKIVKAPYAPVGETEFTFYVTLGYDNNTSVFEDVDLLSDFHIYFKAKGADTATELTFDDVENRYSFTMKASSDEIGEGTLILTGTRNDLDRLAVSVWEDEDEAPENWEYADEPCVAILTYDKESNDYLLLNEDEELVSVPFTFTNTYTKIVTDVTAKFNVEKVVERQRGSRKPGKADFTFEAYYTDANGKLVKIDQTLTISTWGVGKYNASWDLVVPAAAFNDNGVASLTVKEVNGKKSGWTYDKTAYELIVTRDGKVSFPAKTQANAETDSAAALTVTFTNSYYKHSFNGGGDKPIKSVKTGDMGIAMYAMTSLLSLGGAALVIKKRKDEE